MPDEVLPVGWGSLTLSLRPEKIALHRERPAEGANVFRAVIENTVYLGELRGERIGDRASGAADGTPSSMTTPGTQEDGMGRAGSLRAVRDRRRSGSLEP